MPNLDRLGRKCGGADSPARCRQPGNGNCKQTITAGQGQNRLGFGRACGDDPVQAGLRPAQRDLDRFQGVLGEVEATSLLALNFLTEMSVTAPDGSRTSYAYSSNTVTVTDPAGKWKLFTTDVMGNLVQVQESDPALGTVSTNYT